MTGWLCNFLPCRWWHCTNVAYDELGGHVIGLWQCRRCKTLSIGRAHYIAPPKVSP
jgi:hypothetical protein